MKLVKYNNFKVDLSHVALAAASVDTNFSASQGRSCRDVCMYAVNAQGELLTKKRTDRDKLFLQ